MHQMFFSVKRVHLRIVEVSKRLVREFGLTPARFDLLRVVEAHHPHPVSQSKIRRADEKLYEAKNQGRNRVCH